MPATSERQRRLFAAALAIKRGKAKPKGQAAKLAGTIGAKTLREFAVKKAK